MFPISSWGESLTGFGFRAARRGEPDVVGELDPRARAARFVRSGGAQFLALAGRAARARAVRVARIAREARRDPAPRAVARFPRPQRRGRVPKPGLPRAGEHHRDQRGADQRFGAGVHRRLLVARRSRARRLAAGRRHADLVPRRAGDRLPGRAGAARAARIPSRRRVDPAGDAALGTLLGAGEALPARAARRDAHLRPRRDRRGDAVAALFRGRAARTAAPAERDRGGRGALRGYRRLGARVSLLEPRRRRGGRERGRVHDPAPAGLRHGAGDCRARRIVPRLSRRGLRHHPDRGAARDLATYCSTLMPAARMTSVQRFVSLWTKAPNWSTVSTPPCAPCAESFCATSGVLTARATSSRSASIAALGVPFGTAKPNQLKTT